MHTRSNKKILQMTKKEMLRDTYVQIKSSKCFILCRFNSVRSDLAGNAFSTKDLVIIYREHRNILNYFPNLSEREQQTRKLPLAGSPLRCPWLTEMLTWVLAHLVIRGKAKANNDSRAMRVNHDFSDLGREPASYRQP